MTVTMGLLLISSMSSQHGLINGKYLLNINKCYILKWEQETKHITIPKILKIVLKKNMAFHLTSGIAANTRLAKICSDLNKPNGQYYLPQDRDQILQFISSLSIRKVSGSENAVSNIWMMDTVCLHAYIKN